MQRSDLEILCESPVEIRLAGLRYSVAPLKVRDALMWQQRFLDGLNVRGVSVTEIKKAFTAAADGGAFADDETAMIILDGVRALVARNAIHAWDMTVDYVARGAGLSDEEKQHISVNADYGEALEAAMQILPIAFPFGKIQAAIGRRSAAMKNPKADGGNSSAGS